jgi:hypothetical protein
MILISGARASAVAAAFILHGLALLFQTATAARVDDVYSATVPVAGASPGATAAAFAEALRRVLVKVTGRASAGADAVLLERFGDPAALVQQFRRDGAGQLWARFDPGALRRVLQAAGVPAWGEDRPMTIVWLAYDTGTGERDVLSSGGPDTLAASSLRRGLLEAASASAVPVVLPLRDSQELASVTYADVWGEFSEQVVRASERYRADALLLGRARLFPAGMQDVRWTLLAGDERLEWRGGVADGPRGLAERLALRLAVAPGADAGTVRLAVSGITSMDQYGSVSGYLRGIEVIESLAVTAVATDTMVFEIALRGSRDQLARSLALRSLLEPAAPDSVGIAPLPGPAPDLRYRLASGR